MVVPAPSAFQPPGSQGRLGFFYGRVAVLSLGYLAKWWTHQPGAGGFTGAGVFCFVFEKMPCFFQRVFLISPTHLINPQATNLLCGTDPQHHTTGIKERRPLLCLLVLLLVLLLLINIVFGLVLIV